LEELAKKRMENAKKESEAQHRNKDYFKVFTVRILFIYRFFL
jgi:hypothetical protein